MRAKCQHLCKMPHIPHCGPRSALLSLSLLVLPQLHPLFSVLDALSTVLCPLSTVHCPPVQVLKVRTDCGLFNVLFTITTTLTLLVASTVPVAATWQLENSVTWQLCNVRLPQSRQLWALVLTSPKTSFRSRIDLERVSAL